jgi:hypothetical protein
MTKDVILKLDDNGQVYGPGEHYIGMVNANGVQHFGEPAEPTSIKDLINLREAGFTADEIVELKNAGVL